MQAADREPHCVEGEVRHEAADHRGEGAMRCCCLCGIRSLIIAYLCSRYIINTHIIIIIYSYTHHTHIIYSYTHIYTQQLQQQLTAVRNSAVNNLLVEEKELEKAVLTLEKVIVCVLPIVIHAHASSTLRLIIYDPWMDGCIYDVCIYRSLTCSVRRSRRM